ncbi:hypothetical protein [Antarcticirhabdus aurantiaca]|uniref:Uncharacterized protein n=1 Tax=Antarcticirhabdus aurantiaca TaxID=2606717 RepID=A0ACD4NJ49_9HYPH|nr:hypothetical protein OXU80_18770 [Jeongeuplla avenae]
MIGILPATLAVMESHRGGPMTKVVVADGSGALVVDYLVGDFARRPGVAEAWAERHVLAWNAQGALIAATLAARETFLMIEGAAEGATLKAIEEALTIAGVDLSRTPGVGHDLPDIKRFAPPETGAPPATDHPQRAEGAAR